MVSTVKTPNDLTFSIGMGSEASGFSEVTFPRRANAGPGIPVFPPVIRCRPIGVKHARGSTAAETAQKRDIFVIK